MPSSKKTQFFIPMSSSEHSVKSEKIAKSTLTPPSAQTDMDTLAMHNLNKIEKNITLAKLNTFGSECIAKYYIAISDIESLRAIFLKIYSKDMPLLILGAGSNILFTKDFEGLVLQLKNIGISLIREDKYNVCLKVEAGMLWHNLVLYCIEKGYGGLENLSLIPIVMVRNLSCPAVSQI